jgi:hypothetical protein
MYALKDLEFGKDAQKKRRMLARSASIRTVD